MSKTCFSCLIFVLYILCNICKMFSLVSVSIKIATDLQLASSDILIFQHRYFIFLILFRAAEDATHIDHTNARDAQSTAANLLRIICTCMASGNVRVAVSWIHSPLSWSSSFSWKVLGILQDFVLRNLFCCSFGTQCYLISDTVCESALVCCQQLQDITITFFPLKVWIVTKLFVHNKKCVCAMHNKPKK